MPRRVVEYGQGMINKLTTMRFPRSWRFWLVLAIGLGLAFLVGISVVLQPGFVKAVASAPAQASGNNLEALGQAIFTEYLLPFELASLLLLVAMVAAMVLGKRRA